MSELDFSRLDRALRNPDWDQRIRAVKLAKAKRYLQALAKRKMEGLSLYRSLPVAARFHACRKKIRLADGANQAGKTLAAEVEVSRAVSGLDPKYPHRNGLALIVGKDAQHLANPMWRTLAHPGAFSVIPDEDTGLLRSVRPSADDPTKLDPYDEAYREKWRDAPPLLPERMIKSIAWEDRSKGIPRVVTLVTGWKMLWHTADGRARQGIQINLWHFDEEILNQDFLREAIRGSMRYGGLGFWSATPQSGGLQLSELHERAISGDPDVEAFTFSLEDNPYLTRDEKRVFYNQLSDEEREACYYGHYLAYGRRIYPLWSPMGMHGCEPFDIPEHWTRYIALDPGRQHCGTLFAAIDPEEAHVWVYDAFDLQNADAARWADEIHKRQGKTRFEAIIIDSRYGKEHHGATESVAEHYALALKQRGIEPRTAGPLAGFFPGCDDVATREEALLAWMAVRGHGPFTGTCKLQVFRGRMPKLEDQVRKAQIDPKNPRKRIKQPEDLLVCLEYLAGTGDLLRYTPVESVAEPDDDRVYRNWQKRQQRLSRNRTPGVELG